MPSQTIPIFIQPFLRRFTIRTMRAKQRVKMSIVFQDDGVAQLVNDDIIYDKCWSFDQPPVDGDVFFGGAVAPFPFLTADIEFVIWQKQSF